MVLDEHDESLQDERSPTWHARDVATERARRAGVPCWLVSPTPTLEALDWAGDRVQRPSRIDERVGWPFVEVVDRSAEEAPTSSPVTRSLLDLCRDPGQRVVCVLNTKGRARRLMCRSCQALVTCAGCGAGVTQDRAGLLVCERCGATRPALCGACGSTRLAGVGIGIARLREELEAAIHRPVVEVSSDTPDEAVSGAPRGAVFLGTEAVLHRVGSATAVVFVDLDDELLAPRFRAAQDTMALIVRAARLVGPRASGGRVLLQTNQPRHEVVQAALHADPSRLAPAERERRELLGLPPVRALAAVTGTLAPSWLRSAPAGLEVAGPAGGRWLLRATTWDVLADALESLGPRPRGVRVEVDPHRV
jgi:primosomal protein N' (replication factor Y)